MNGKQENKLSMYYAVQKVCSANNGVWNGLPAFVTAFGDYMTNIGKIEEALEVQETKIKGVTVNKEALQEAMVSKALEMAHAVFAYADDKDDFTLKEKVDFSRSDLKKGRDSFVMQRCQVIHSEASAIIGSLIDYGIGAADLTELQNRIDACNASLSTPRTAITNRKGAGDELDKLFSSTNRILKSKLDKLMEKFKISNSDFYRSYFNARKIVNAGLRHEEENPDKPQKPAA